MPTCECAETIHLASFCGRVTDPSHALVTGAAVTARQLETNITSSSVTDREGRFRFPYLKVGQYQLTVRKTGVYITWTKDEDVQVREPGAVEPHVIGPEGGFANLFALETLRLD